MHIASLVSMFLRQRARLAVFACVAISSVSAHAQQSGKVIEYYHRGVDAYFITGRASEQALLDALPSAFSRTGAEFSAGTTADITLTRICRFYISIADPYVSSHFYGREDTDCALIRSIKPAGFADEGFDFSVAVQRSDGSCPASAPVAVYRSFRAAANGRTPNHRYTVSRAEYDAMTASGWTPEGIVFCVTSAKSANALNRAAFKTVVTSALSPFAANCDGATATGTSYVGAEVEPHIARNPNNEDHLLASWQQDRWSDGGARGLGGAVSFDGGRTWSATPAPFSRCGGGNGANGGGYVRATDPWSAIGSDGTAYQMALSFTDTTPSVVGVSAMLVSRSTDGGRNWQPPVTLIRDVSDTIFNDKNMMIVDPIDSRFAYAVWGRIDDDGSGPTWFSRTIDRGATWEPARNIFDPGRRNQTFGNNLAVASDGTLVNVFLEFIRETGSSNIVSAKFRLVRSTDRGVTWSQPIDVSDSRSVGTVDPETKVRIRDGSGIVSIAAGSNRSLHLVWQDARFNGGAFDSIVYSRSDDAGLTWSAPRRINARTNVAAFTPIVNVRSDGVIGVAYYDFRANTASAQTLPTVTRLTTSTDGVVWYESEVDSAFNILTAPLARGYFVGDYFGLTSRKGAFEAFFVRSTGDTNNNRTEAVFASMPEGTLKRRVTAFTTQEASADAPIGEAFRARIGANVERLIATRRRGG
jgi:hypothetical protein